MTTLADLTPEERAQCRGMWCDFPDPDERTNLAIYVGDSPNNQGFCELIHEGQLGTLTIPENLTPRDDLPRAWAPHGKPAAGEWEYAVQYLTPDGWKYSRPSWENRWQDSEAVQEVRAHRDHPGQETRIVRRLVGQPEVMEA
ncbi:hypothetical protein [Corynebacterium sp. HMSC076D02]|uniref:hypothetical protein n=1 Tax=Corynebacterium sp. HMSC076D02 TaxID=1739439 RepID=UPI000AB7D242|nr:hypothetical protein [Corynebacterium sp. HMSC076D02]